MGQTEPNSQFFSQIFADFRFSWKLQHFGDAGFRRKPQETADFRRKPQETAETRLSHWAPPYRFRPLRSGFWPWRSRPYLQSLPFKVRLLALKVQTIFAIPVKIHRLKLIRQPGTANRCPPPHFWPQKGYFPAILEFFYFVPLRWKQLENSRKRCRVGPKQSGGKQPKNSRNIRKNCRFDFDGSGCFSGCFSAFFPALFTTTKRPSSLLLILFLFSLFSFVLPFKIPSFILAFVHQPLFVNIFFHFFCLYFCCLSLC